MSELTVVSEETEPPFVEVELGYALRGSMLYRKTGKIGAAQAWLIAKGWLQPSPSVERYVELTEAGRAEAERRKAIYDEALRQ